MCGFLAFLITGLVCISGCVSNGDNEEPISKETGSINKSADVGEAGVSVANESAKLPDANNNTTNAKNLPVSNVDSQNSGVDNQESENLKNNLYIMGYHDEFYKNTPGFNDGFWVVGKAENIGQKTIKNAKIIVNYYDEEGDLLETSYDALEEWEDEDGYLLTLEPEDVWNFEVWYPKKDHYKIDSYEAFVDFVELE